MENNLCNGPNWESKKENLKSRFPKISDHDLEFKSEESERMLTRLCSLLGMSSEELDMVILTS